MTNTSKKPLHQLRQGLIQELTRSFKAFQLPPSMLLGDNTLMYMLDAEREWRTKYKSPREEFDDAANRLLSSPPEELSKLRQEQANEAYASPQYKYLRESYKTTISKDIIEGVPIEIFAPESGIASKNEKRVLLNLHGGGFIFGVNTMSHFESIPIASLGQIKVVSITYRMAPEDIFPSATDDICNVYKTLLRQYDAKNIGVFGSSTGGALVGQALARFIKDGLPMPGAAIMAGGSAHGWQDGDSGYLASALYDYPHFPDFSENYPYFRNTDPTDPLVAPGYHSNVLNQFPPSLLASSTRDSALSVVVKTHSELVRSGVTSDLHVWEGFQHCFFLDSRIPESREFHDVCINFFQKHLGIQ